MATHRKNLVLTNESLAHGHFKGICWPDGPHCRFYGSFRRRQGLVIKRDMDPNT